MHSRDKIRSPFLSDSQTGGFTGFFRRRAQGSVYRCRHLDKLPATVLSLSKVVECEEEFCHRLLRHAVIEDVSACVPLQGWRLKRAVGYWRLKRFPSLRLEIDCLLARSGAAI